jgi:hypothetical protein
MEDWLMAAYWIKVCLDTPRKPEMRLAAKMARLTKEQVFWHWFHLYAWADGQTADGFIPQLNLEDVAESSGVSLEFCRALSSPEIGWLFEAGGDNPGVMFRNWERHNGRCAKQRAQGCRRAQISRAKRRIA